MLFIMADDLGYGDLNCYGRPDYQTPSLDGLAQQGIKFMSAYTAAPVCTPTRCAFHTGRYPQRLAVGLQEPLTARSPQDVGLPPTHPTISSLLRGAGYDTALIGKWHLGWKPEFGPNRHGYESSSGFSAERPIIHALVARYGRTAHGQRPVENLSRSSGWVISRNCSPTERSSTSRGRIPSRFI